MTEMKKKSDYRVLFGTMLAFGIVGLLASFVLSVEKVHLLENPNAVLTCSINLVLNCAGVMNTWQSAVFGFPNMYIGLMGFSVVITVAVMGLVGNRFSRGFLRAAQVGYTLGIVFAYWLFFQSLYAIQILCPWCLIVTTSTTIIFATITTYNLRNNVFSLAKSADRKVQAFLAGGYHKLAVAVWLVLMIALVFLQFGSDLFAG